MKTRSLIILAIGLLSLVLPLSVVNAGAGTPPAAGPSASGGDSVLCDIFPFLRSIGSVSSICTGSEEAAEDAAEQIRNFVQLGLSLVFVGIIAISIFVIIRAALKYIRSEGEPDKIQDAQKAIKSVFIGIGALFVGVIGIIIVLAFFQATGAINTDNGGTGNDFIDDNLLD